jgi:hypothetical protein
MRTALLPKGARCGVRWDCGFEMDEREKGFGEEKNGIDPAYR